MDNFDLNGMLLIFSHFKETFFLVVGSAIALIVLYLRDYRLSGTDKNYLYYLFEADRKQTDRVIVTLFGLVCMELLTGALTGLDTQQLLLAGAGLGYSTKRKVGEGDNSNTEQTVVKHDPVQRLEVPVPPSPAKINKED